MGLQRKKSKQLGVQCRRCPGRSKKIDAIVEDRVAELAGRLTGMIDIWARKNDLSYEDTIFITTIAGRVIGSRYPGPPQVLAAIYQSASAHCAMMSGVKPIN